MRLHRLELKAFGPYAGTEIIDFDAIAADGGFFLLRGHTGSGKTSILDAICFALYGDLPGARSGGRDHLRSDHTDDGEEPWVALEFSVRRRRFKVERTPMWFRPKKRGTGTVKANPTATLQEEANGVWQVLGSKPQDVNPALQPLLGMDKDQFTRVAMLPQGDFAKFLHSTSDERAGLLRKLFDTTVFDRAVELAAERHRELRESTGAHLAQRQAAVDELVSGLSERWDERVLADLATTGSTPGEETELLPGEQEWFTAVAHEARSRADAAGQRHREATQRSAHARAELEAAQQRVQDQRVLVGYADRVAALESRAVHEAELRRRIRAHEQSQRLVPFLDAQDRAMAEFARARDALGQTADRATTRPGAPESGEAAMSAAEEAAAPLTRSGEEISWHHRLRDLAETDDRQALDHATLEAVDGALEQGAHLVLTAKDRQNQAATALALEARAKAAASNLASARAEHGSAVKGQHTASTELEAAQQRLEAVLQEQTKAPDRDEERAAQEVEEARTVLMSAQRADTLDLEVHAARERRDAARTEEREAYSAQVALFTARSQAMALALAQDLVPGGPCTVCGSVEHPAPATAGGDGSPEHSHADLGQGALDAAQHRAETARQNESTCQESLTQAEQRHANAATKAHGLSVEAARAALQHAIEDHEEVVKAWRAHRGAVERLGAAQQRVASCTAALETARNVVTQSQQYLEGAKHHDEESRAAAQEALAGHPDGQSMVEAAETERTALDRTVRSLETLRTALTSLRDAGTRAHAELEHSGQAAGAVREHLLPEPQAQAIRTELTALDTERARLEELEASAPVRRAQAARDAGETPPDEQAVAALEETRHHAEQAQDAASAVVGAARSVVADVQRARDRVTQADRELGPLLDQARTAKSVAELMAGNGENLKGMSLPTYVLAARLETVAEAATHRLAAMGEGRYRLLHQDGKQGNRHSGLGLAVEDAWTGATRAPETLSGGETFMVSLALALGLADVVQEESGGIDVETLFVDEGFGTLDQQTLDDVLNGLDRLRAGGRLVGIVSHVPELAERIPTQIRVTKTRAGSTTSVVTAAGPE